MNNWAMKFLFYSAVSMLITGIQKNKKSGNIPMKLPEFYGVLEVKHAMSGRMRLFVPSIKGNFEQADVLLQNFKKIDGVYGIEVNPILGTVLVTFDENKLPPTLIIGIIIKLLGLENEIKKEPVSAVKKEAQAIRHSLNHAVYNKTKGFVDLKDVFLLSFLSLGLYKTKIQGYDVGGPTLLWWAYSLLSRHGRE